MNLAPRAVRHFGLAAMEARAGRTQEIIRPMGPPAARPQRFVLRLWLPMTLVFLLLAPFAILLIPLFRHERRPTLRPADAGRRQDQR